MDPFASNKITAIKQSTQKPGHILWHVVCNSIRVVRIARIKWTLFLSDSMVVFPTKHGINALVTITRYDNKSVFFIEHGDAHILHLFSKAILSCETDYDRELLTFMALDLIFYTPKRENYIIFEDMKRITVFRLKH